MEFKFKTVYLNKLISCSINEFDNSIRNDEGIKIGKIEKTALESRIPVLPIFQYTGRKDIDGNEIYSGHLVKNSSGIEYEIIFDESDSSFSLENTEELIRMSKFDSYKIVGHSLRGVPHNLAY